MYQEKKYTAVRKFYAWVGFVVCWFVGLPLFGFIIWSMIEQDKAINLLVNLFS